MSEFIPKKTIKRTAKSKKVAKKQENYRRYQKVKAERQRKQKWEDLKRFEDYKKPNELFLWEVQWAKNRFAMFMERTGNIIDLDRLSYHMVRRGQTAIDELLRIHPDMSHIERETLWIMFRPGWGKRPALNQEKLRRIAVRLQIPFWKDMKTDEIRAMILLLEWKRGFLPEPKVEVNEV